MIVKIFKTFESLEIESGSNMIIIIEKYIILLSLFINIFILLQTFHHFTRIYLHIFFYTNVQIFYIFYILQNNSILIFSMLDLFDKELRIWCKYPFIFVNEEWIYPWMFFCDCIVIKFYYYSEYFCVLIAWILLIQYEIIFCKEKSINFTFFE